MLYVGQPLDPCIWRSGSAPLASSPCVQEPEQAQQAGPSGRSSIRRGSGNEGEADPEPGPGKDTQVKPRRTPEQQAYNNEVLSQPRLLA